MVNYNNGKIYKIEDVGGNMCYVGSTTKDFLSKRMVNHRASYTSWKANKSLKVMVYDIFEAYGVENCRIVLIELFPCLTKDELGKREAHYIKLMDCVNRNIPCRTRKEYQLDNNDDIKIWKKQYYEDNKVEILEQYSEYYKAHKDAIITKMMKKVNCKCGGKYTHGHKNRHFKTEKHLTNLIE